jgi:F-type H+-transporting ATPase subunit a
MRNVYCVILFYIGLSVSAFAQGHEGHEPQATQHAGTEHAHEEGSHDCGHHVETVFDPAGTASHHIADANVYSIGPLQLPLPCILYERGKGFSVFMASKFGFERLGHGTGTKAYKGFVLEGGTVKHVIDPSFPMGEVAIDGIVHKAETDARGKEVSIGYACYGGNQYRLESKHTFLDGILGGNSSSSFIDFSITKNVMSMILVFVFFYFMFKSVAKAYKLRDGQEPKGLQSFIEVIIVFLRDEVAKPFLGNKWEKFFPFLLSVFFFILGFNLFGQIPFFGGSNVTGNLNVTLVLALFTLVMVTINGNKHYWQHIFNMPGVPPLVKLILTPVEILGVFIKPLTLTLRLFANIAAGHMVIIIFVGLIFLFGKMGESRIGGIGAVVPSALLSLFMMAIELLVAFLQAFVFTILSASYLGAATEEHHHAEEAHH